MSTDSNDWPDYRLTRIETVAATGYFDCMPTGSPDFDQALTAARSRPNDEFMRKYLLRQLAAWQPEVLKRAILNTHGEDLFVRALFFEACLLFGPFAQLRRLFPAESHKRLARSSPLVFIKAHCLDDHRLHWRWIERLRPNFLAHAPLPAFEDIGLPPPVDESTADQALAVMTPLAQLHPAMSPQTAKGASAGMRPEAMAASALTRLAEAGIPVGAEMRHEASLSPIALLRSWQLDLRVASGRHRYRLQGEQIAYGRGMDLASARVACVMEVVERVSAYARVAAEGVPGYVQSHALIHARLSELKRQGRSVMDPNRLGLEAPYRDEPLYWIEGEKVTPDGLQSVLIPAQCVFLFCNLDEVKLFSGLGSNGLGAGATPEQARCKALLEILERDSAATVPFVPELCFDVETGDEQLSGLLHSYAARGIRVGFADLTGPLGVPCCKCYVVDGQGQVAAGTSAALDARQALLSALTETPYPFPNGPPSQPLPPAKVRVPLEALPNYDLGDWRRNLALLERLLLENGYEPIYVDLTRADLCLPVARAIVPGMELMGDFDRFSRVHPRLYGHYRRHAPQAASSGT